jgi:hypothetical protein
MSMILNVTETIKEMFIKNYCQYSYFNLFIFTKNKNIYSYPMDILFYTDNIYVKKLYYHIVPMNKNTINFLCLSLNSYEQPDIVAIRLIGYNNYECWQCVYEYQYENYKLPWIVAKTLT